jgi:hypothetical protein
MFVPRFMAVAQIVYGNSWQAVVGCRSVLFYDGIN